MEKVFIENRKGKRVAVLVEKSEPQKGLAFVMHGLGGFKEQDHIVVMADTFREKGFTVVRFDTTNTFGESDGAYEQATVMSYYEDLEDVIAWAKKEEWYQEPFVLSGHSLGAMCTTLYAERYQEKVLALAPVSVLVSGALSVEAHQHLDADDFANWQRTGWQETESKSKPGVIKRLPWSHMIDRMKYDLLTHALKLTMPVLIVVGDQDEVTPSRHVQLLFDALPGVKEMHIVKNAPHTFRDDDSLTELKRIFQTWISNGL